MLILSKIEYDEKFFFCFCYGGFFFFIGIVQVMGYEIYGVLINFYIYWYVFVIFDILLKV